MTLFQPGARSVPKLHITAFNNWDEISQARLPWDDLLSDSSSRSAFLTWEWLTSWWRAYGESGELMLLGCFRTDGRLVGIAPLYRRRCRVWMGFSLRVLRLVGDGSDDSDNLDFIVRRGYEAAVVRTVLDWLCRHRSDWNILELNPVPSESPVAAALIGELAARHWPYLDERTPHLLVPLPREWDAYLASLSKNMRSRIGYTLRRVEKRYQVRLRRCQAQDELRYSLDRLYEMHGKRWQLRGEPGSFRLSQRRAFYYDLATQFLSRGWLGFWLLDLNGRTVAAEFGFRYANTYYYLQGGFDPEYRSHSVGLVLRALVLSQIIRDGVQRFDFLGGDEDHKMVWGAERHSYYRLRCAQPHSLGAAYLDVVTAFETSKEWLRKRVPTCLWSFLSRIYHQFKPYQHAILEEQSCDRS